MRRILFITLVLGFASVGCGGKDKKKTTPSKANAGDTSGDSSGDTGATTPSANLGEIIYFEFDSTELSPDARATLEQNATWLKEDPARVVTIEGHTDEVGTPAYNLGLGERRAIAAKDYMVRLGIEDKRVSIISYGEEKPAGSEDNLNRRSVFIATKK
jgi:peptidoglycan-associated lipoprotein